MWNTFRQSWPTVIADAICDLRESPVLLLLSRRPVPALSDPQACDGATAPAGCAVAVVASLLELHRTRRFRRAGVIRLTEALSRLP
jgi:hypothetical protein